MKAPIQRIYRILSLNGGNSQISINLPACRIVGIIMQLVGNGTTGGETASVYVRSSSDTTGSPDGISDALAVIRTQICIGTAQLLGFPPVYFPSDVAWAGGLLYVTGFAGSTVTARADFMLLYQDK